ncbi:MAG: metallophosphoesterase, partial [Candidatus Xenobia bacterium]
YHRLVRLLQEQDLLLQGTLDVNPAVKNVDLILIGDFVDWRGEPLEGDSEDWVSGSQRIVNLIHKLHKEYLRLRNEDGEFQTYVYPILGNHDEMMLEAPRIFTILHEYEIELITSSSHQYSQLRKNLQSMGLAPDAIEIVLRFLNWYLQGGNVTIQGFGGLREWFEAMDGELGKFLRDDLRLGVVVNKRLYSHTMPDMVDFWRPLEEIPTLSNELRDKAKEAYIWGRKLWGFDYISGTRTKAFTQKEVEEFLTKVGVEGLVVGHTPMSCPDPYFAFDGKVINIDLHGVPGSKAFVEVYELGEGGAVPSPFVAARVSTGLDSLPSLDKKAKEAAERAHANKDMKSLDEPEPGAVLDITDLTTASESGDIVIL